jgi:hypothetical protein
VARPSGSSTQDRFPRVNDAGEYEGQPTPPQFPIPTGARQTEEVLAQGRTNHARRFVVQHNGLYTKPAYCPDSGMHPIEVDPNFHYVGSGCPNRWVLAEAQAGQITGYQTVADITNLSDLEAAFQNARDNSDGIFLEIYEGIGRAADASGLPSGMTLGDWAEQFHQRRRADWPSIPDPFPLTHAHTFTRTATNSSAPQLLYFINAANCVTNCGVVAILPDLSFTSIEQNPDGSVRLILAVARAGTLRVEHSADLAAWESLESQSTAGGTVEFTDPPASSQARFYRAVLLEP